VVTRDPERPQPPPEAVSSGRRGRGFGALPILLAVLTGVAAGIGGYTFRYAKGLSYFSTDPKACVNCHIMQPQYDAWQKASHHTAAVCIDCHLPHSFIPKYLAKAENGWRHGKLFTTQGFREPIELAPAGQEILQANCKRCHSRMLHGLPWELGSSDWAVLAGASQDELRCVHCHASVGHGDRLGLGGPLLARETSELLREGNKPMQTVATEREDP